MPYPKKSATSRMVARDKHRQAKWKRVRFRDNRTVKEDDTWSLGGCWCGEGWNHDWPGRSEGEKHPNPREIQDLTPKQQEREMRVALQDAGVCPICRGYPETPDLQTLESKRVGLPPPNGCRTCLYTGIFPPPTMAAAERIRKLK